jgi:hypothetical protein
MKKKLSNEEKLKLIDEELESEENQVLRERLADYEKGEMTFRSWEEVKREIEEKLKQQRSENK